MQQGSRRVSVVREQRLWLTARAACNSEATKVAAQDPRKQEEHQRDIRRAEPETADMVSAWSKHDSSTATSASCVHKHWHVLRLSHKASTAAGMIAC
jgi:uncharacterized Zn finger protein (UPF0148 family)